MIPLLIASLIWAFSFGLIGNTLKGVDTYLVAWIRLALSLLVFIPFLRIRRVSNRAAFQLIGIGAIQYGVMYVSYLYAYNYLLSHQIALLTITTPLFVSAIYDLSTRRLHITFLGAAILSVMGGAFLKYSSVSIAPVLEGILLVQVSNICFAFGQVSYRRLVSNLTGETPTLRDHDLFGLLYMGGLLTASIPLCAAIDWPAVRLSEEQLMALLYLGVLPSGLCFYLWNLGARRVNPGTLAAMNNVKIPLAILVSLLIFREEIDLGRFIAGAVIIIGAIALSQLLVNRARNGVKR